MHRGCPEVSPLGPFGEAVGEARCRARPVRRTLGVCLRRGCPEGVQVQRALVDAVRRRLPWRIRSRLQATTRTALSTLEGTVCYAILLPGRNSGPGGFRRNSNRESLNIGPSVGFFPAEIRPGNPISGSWKSSISGVVKLFPSWATISKQKGFDPTFSQGFQRR